MISKLQSCHGAISVDSIVRGPVGPLACKETDKEPVSFTGDAFSRTCLIGTSVWRILEDYKMLRGKQHKNLQHMRRSERER